MPFVPSPQPHLSPPTQPWETHSNSRQQTTLSIGCLAAGALLVLLLQGAEAGGNGAAGFWFGVILLIIGAATLAANARQSIVVDPRMREIRVEDRRLMGRQMRRIPFGDISDVQVACLQTRTQNAIRYCLQLQLRGGEPYVLFAPERVYSGADDPAVVAGWRAQLNIYLATDPA